MYKHTPKHTIDTILFDLGGVLIELCGIQKISVWYGGRCSNEEIWERWLTSLAVRDFESGKSTPEEFSKALLGEFPIPVESKEFLAEFGSWLLGKYPGVDEMLSRLGNSYRVACFSNTNQIHWPKIRDEFGLGNLFHEHFVSYKMGLLKPDKEAFSYVIANLDCPAGSILFFDDNQINVRAACEMGINAICVSGPDEVNEALCRLELM